MAIMEKGNMAGKPVFISNCKEDHLVRVPSTEVTEGSIEHQFHCPTVEEQVIVKFTYRKGRLIFADCMRPQKNYSLFDDTYKCI
jgi:hypothetical protein